MIYLDNAATTKPDEEVLSLFTKINLEHFGNSGSLHHAGQDAAKILRKAKEDVLSSLGLSSTHNVIFLSGATEANNLALKGVAFQYQNRGKKIISEVGEHSSVLSPLKELKEAFGFNVTMLPVDEAGKVTCESLEKEMDDDTIIVSILAVNNEIGGIHDVKKLSSIVHKHPKAFFHVDATQAIGKVQIDYKDADLISFSGHKFGGLKGTGCLVYKKTIKFFPINAGGSQEGGFRGGTVNVPGAVSLAFALKKAIASQKENFEKYKLFRSRMIEGLLKTGEVAINSKEEGYPGILNFSLLHKKASVVVEALSEKGIFVSTRAACDERIDAPSKLLVAMGKDKELAENAIRVSPYHETTMEEIDAFIATFSEIVKEVKDR